MSQIYELARFLEYYGIDQKGFWMCPTADGSNQIEISMRTETGICAWTLTHCETRRTMESTSDHLEHSCLSMGVDLNYFTQQLRQNVLNQTVFAHFHIQEVSELLGEEAVKQALTDHQFFAQELLSVVNQAVQKKQEQPDLEDLSWKPQEQSDESAANVIRIGRRKTPTRVP